MWKLRIEHGQTLEGFGFRLGDRVVFVKDCDSDNGVVFGNRGVVCDLDTERVGVRWDSMNGVALGHSCAGHCDGGHGWYVDPNTLELEIKEEPICMSDDDLNDLIGMIL